MIPGLHAVMAEAPGLLEAYQTVHELFVNSSIDKDEFTVVWQSINVEHACHYCVPLWHVVGNLYQGNLKAASGRYMTQPK